jgi:hypothetical protein
MEEFERRSKLADSIAKDLGEATKKGSGANKKRVAKAASAGTPVAKAAKSQQDSSAI